MSGKQNAAQVRAIAVIALDYAFANAGDTCNERGLSWDAPEYGEWAFESITSGAMTAIEEERAEVDCDDVIAVAEAMHAAGERE